MTVKMAPQITVKHESHQQSTIKTGAVHIWFVEDKEALTHVGVLHPSYQKHFTNAPYLHFSRLPVILYDLSDWMRH
jgi:hypothetical protein